MRHCIQYALVGGRTVYNTEHTTDEQLAGGDTCAVHRFNRCPLCEEWTTYNGKLREDVRCPAVAKELITARKAVG